MWATWMAYGMAVAAVLGLGGVATEHLLRRASLPARWVWVVALAGSLTVPLLTWHLPGLSGGTDTALAAPPPVQAVAVGEVPPATGAPSLVERVQTAAAVLDPLLVGILWPALSLLLAGVFASSAWRLGRARRSWSRRVVDDELVRVSPDVGPAVVGLAAPEIVLPEWVLRADRETRGWILRHEREHLRARDPQLTAAALGVALLLPWNLPLWWHIRRLRQAVELDCDTRVLAGRARRDRRRYGSLLLDVGRRVHPRPFLAAFAEPATFLERRIHQMSVIAPARTLFHAVLAGIVGGLVVLGAGLLPGPDRPAAAAAGDEAEAPERVQRAISEQPTFTSFTTAPVLTNPAEVREVLQREYPPLLRDAGIGGVADVFVFVDQAGVVRNARVDETSGHRPLDDAALRVTDVMRFQPALDGDRVVPVWISLPVAFGTTEIEADRRTEAVRPGEEVVRQRLEATARELAEVRARLDETVERAEAVVRRVGEEPVVEREPSAGPAFTPYTTAPSLRNATEVQEALERFYPAELRSAGIGGTAEVWFLISPSGAVQDTRINRPSGHEALDAAALQVADAMEFTPGLNRDEPVEVWISLPITFQVR